MPNTNTLPIIKLINARITMLDSENINPVNRTAVFFQLTLARQCINAARLILQTEDMVASVRSDKTWTGTSTQQHSEPSGPTSSS